MINVETIPHADFLALKPLRVPDAGEPTDIFDTHGHQYEMIKAVHEIAPRNVWTVLEIDGKTTVASGLHYVNRAGYMITKHPAPFEHTETKLPTVYYTCVMEIKLGEVAYVVVSATDEDDIEQAAIDAIIEQHDIDEDNHESISCLFVFEGNPDCIRWEGKSC